MKLPVSVITPFLCHCLIIVLLDLLDLPPQSSQLFSTVSRTRLVYSLRFSLYRFDASTLAGDDVFGSFKRLCPCQRMYNSLFCPYRNHIPLDARQNGSNVVCGRPAILQDIQTQLARPVYIGMEHLADKLDGRGLVGVCLFKVHHKAKCSVFKGCVCRTNDDSVPVCLLAATL